VAILFRYRHWSSVFSGNGVLPAADQMTTFDRTAHMCVG
jgi:hypothetical protein